MVVSKSKPRRIADVRGARRRADDMSDEGDVLGVTCPPESHQPARRDQALSIEPDRSEVAMIPQNTSRSRQSGRADMKLMEALDDCYDTRNVWTNADFEEKDIEASLS